MRLPADRVESLRPSFDGRAVCVTGGAGFIGGHLVDALLSLGAKVAVIDDLSNSDAGHLGDLIEIEPDRVRFVHGSILDAEALRDATTGATVVFHLAAIGSVERSMREPSRAWDVNATGTERVLEHARRVGARVVMASSSSAYGDTPTLPKVETMPLAPRSPYAASKVAGEILLKTWAEAYAMETASLRYFNIFGPRQRADSQYAAVIAAFCRAYLAGEAPVIHGDGEQTRDFTFVSNAVLATLLAGSTPLRGEVMNVGTGDRTSINGLASSIARACDASHLTPTHVETRAGDVRDSLASIELARSLIGYDPVDDLDEGLDQTVGWYREAYASTGGGS